jgi:prephenate dehydrogenase
VFGTVAIVGVGLIGGSLGMALRERGLAGTVIGVGRNPATLERAVVLGAVDSYVTSHLPHVLAYALAALAGEESTKNTALFDLAAGSFASATRVAHSSPELWRDICLSNRPALLTALKAYRAELDSAMDALEAGDTNALETAFQRGHDAVKTR